MCTHVCFCLCVLVCLACHALESVHMFPPWSYALCLPCVLEVRGVLGLGGCACSLPQPTGCPNHHVHQHAHTHTHLCMCTCMHSCLLLRANQQVHAMLCVRMRACRHCLCPAGCCCQPRAALHCGAQQLAGNTHAWRMLAPYLIFALFGTRLSPTSWARGGDTKMAPTCRRCFGEGALEEERFGTGMLRNKRSHTVVCAWL